jgi:cell division protein FtsQ
MAARGARFLFFRRRNRRLRGSPGESAAGKKTSDRGSRGARSGAPGKGGSLFYRGLSVALRLGATLLVCGLLGSAGYCARYFVYHSPRFALRQLKLDGNHRVSVESITRRAAVPLGQNLLSINTHEVETRLLGDPWISAVSIRRELPATLRIEVTEHEPAALLALESLYLCDAEGVAYKRATPAEQAELPVVTGVGRAAYVLEPVYAQAQIGAALSALLRYQGKSGPPKHLLRPPIGEIHIDRFVGVTLYTREGMAIELGKGEPTEIEARLARFDAVWQALQKGPSTPRPVMVFLDNRAHPDHIIVRFSEQK